MNPAPTEPRPIVFCCAWCPDKEALHAEIEAAGCRASDGICPACRERYFQRAWGSGAGWGAGA